MPDRDPALQAVLESLEARMLTRRPKGAVRQPEPLLIESGIIFGWHAAFRSLGCATPEAQAALRELVVAAKEETRLNILWAERQQESESAQHPERRAWVAAKTALDEAARAFAWLAAPPEEGR